MDSSKFGKRSYRKPVAQARMTCLLGVSSFPISRLGLPCRVAAYVNAKRTMQSPAGDNVIGGETPFRGGGGNRVSPDRGVTNLEIRNEGFGSRGEGHVRILFPFGIFSVS